MDGPVHEHSDSDSGDSWTLLEPSPAYGDDAPDFSEHPTESNKIQNHEKDEDTDGISIISDSDHESPSPCQLNYESYLYEENRPTENHTSQNILVNPQLSDINNHHESVRQEDDFLGDANGKHKTYVHRRNKRLSTVLNIIVLGSVITAVGVAIGHMWGAKSDCSMHTTPSVNKILSNLYKLQEENAYLRSKLKELMALNNYQVSRQKESVNQNRCKKMFEEPLNNDNSNHLTKCVDNIVHKIPDNYMTESVYENEYVEDINRLKNVYLQNKSWLDEEISKRLKQEEESVKRLKNSKRFSKLQKQKEDKNKSLKEIENNNILPEPQEDTVNPFKEKQEYQEKRISYADSLKSSENVKKINKRESNKIFKVENRDVIPNVKKSKIEHGADDRSASEEEFKKDNRYVGQKFKKDKKNDRHKSHKKDKRRNKYEQWEMKGGLLKDYDAVSFASSQETGLNSKGEFEHDNFIMQDNIVIEKQMGINKNDKKHKDESSVAKHETSNKKVNKNNDFDWYDKRAVFRTEARKMLEQELFGVSNLNSAGWYFRRMHKREQCRAKGDNSTYRKLSKRNMNFKMKH